MGMSTRKNSAALFATLVSAAALVGASHSATASPAPEGKFYGTWTSLYPTSQSGPNVIAGTGKSCQLCHVNSGGGKNYNGYGKKMYDLLKSGSSTSAAIKGSENFDSDMDPFSATSLAEINVSVQPGWTAGPHNTHYNNNGVTATGQLAPSGIAGTLDLCDGSATETVRLGTPPNPNVLLPGTNGPIVGKVWNPVVDHSTFHTTALLDILVVDPGAPINLPFAWGTLLVNISPAGLMLTKPAGAPFALPIPLDCAIVGIAASSQAGSVALADIKLTNALDIVIGTF